MNIQRKNSAHHFRMQSEREQTLVTSTTTGHDGSVVSALASQAKGRGSIPSCGTSFFSHKYFLSNLRQESN